MSWYYALNGKQNGPVEQTELDRLVTGGTLPPASLVWQNGMAEWKPYSEVFRPAASASGTEICTQCGKAFAPDFLVRIDNKNVCADCKPLVVQKLREGVATGADEQTRNEYLKHEASIKSVGTLYQLGGAIYLIGSIFVLLGSFVGPRSSGAGEAVAFTMGMTAFMVVFGAATLYVGAGLKKLKSGCRIISGIFSGLGLLAFPFGTLINAYILYLLFSKKGAFVFSQEYRDIVARTPHIKYRMSIVIWILLILVIVLIGIGMVAAFTSASRR